jgi:iron complex outermembrane receptor protein
VHSITARLGASSALVLAAAIVTPSAAWAQDDAQDTPRNSILVTGGRVSELAQEDETGSRLGLTPLETPASVATLDGDAIRARGDQSVQAAVTRAPGVSNSSNPGNANSSYVMRGFGGATSVLQLYDGVRLYPVADSLSFPTDPWNIDRVEVLSGPASVLYGHGALGGAINVVPKSPNMDRFEFQGEAGYGSQDTWHVAGGVGGPIGPSLGVRADASYRQSDGYVDRGDSDSLALSGALEFRPSADFRLTVRGDYGDVHPQKYFGTPLVDSKLDTSIRHNNYNVGDAILHFKDSRFSADMEWNISDALQFRNVAYFLHSRRKWQNLEIYCWIGASGDCPNGYGYGTPGNVYRSDNYGIVHDQDQYGAQPTLKFTAPLGGSLTNDLVIGVDLNRSKLTYWHDFDTDFQESEVPLNDFDPGTFLETSVIKPRYRTRTDTIAFFAEDRLQVTEQLSLVGGIRVEHDKTGRWNLVYGPDGTTVTGETPALDGGTEAYKTIDHTTWRVGAVYQPTRNLSLYAQYATAVDPLGGLTTYSTSATQFQLTNATGKQYEAGLKTLFLDGAGSFTLAAYRIEKNNLFTQVLTNGPINQVGQRSAQGIEATVAVSLPGGFAINANGAILDANYDDFIAQNDPADPTDDDDFSGNNPANVPEQTANIGLSWSGIENLQLRGDLRYVGRRYSDDANAFRIPSYTVVDFGATYAVTPNVAVDLRLFNAFDKAYAEGVYFDEQWILGRPRSFDVSVRAAF